MDLETAQTTTNAKIAILNMENMEYLSEVPVTTEEKVQKKNDVKARSMLLMALPDEHLMTFNQIQGSQITDKSRKSVGFVSYNAVPPSPTELFSPLKFDLSNSSLKEFQQPKFEGYGPKTSKSVSEYISNEVRESSDASLVKELVSDDKLEKKTVSPTVAKIEFLVLSVEVLTMCMLTAITIKGKWWTVNTAHPKTTVYSARPMSHFSKSAQSTVKRPYQIRTTLTNKSFSQKVNTAKGKFYTARPKVVNTARPNSAVVNAVRGHPQKEDQGYVDSGCSRYMTGNMSYLSDFKEFDGGYVTFRGGAKGGKISGKGTLKTERELVRIKIADGNFWNEIEVKTGNSKVSTAEHYLETATARTIDTREVELTATIDGKVKIVTEASVRRHLQLANSNGISSLPNTGIFEQLSLMGPKKTSWEQFSSNIATAIIFLATNRSYSFDEITNLFETTMRRVHTFVPMDSEIERAIPESTAGSSKRDAEQELAQESSKRQKTGES
ncbi:hypothetical protein Tco_0265085 [Tanacetum coccineum]